MNAFDDVVTELAAARPLAVRRLDPQDAPLAAQHARAGVVLRPTAYIADSLLVRGLPEQSNAGVRERIAAVAESLGLLVGDYTAVDRAHVKVAGRLGERVDALWTSRLPLARASALGPAPDAWLLLQHLIQADPDLARRVSLEHVVSVGAGGGRWGAVGDMWGFVGDMWGFVGHDMWGFVGRGLAEYAQGSGGKTPVAWAGHDPRAGLATDDAQPVVALLDTGMGHHPWFTAADGTALPGVELDPRVAGLPVGLRPTPGESPEGHGTLLDPLNRPLDGAAGHGTFVAGIVRQRCPQARLVAVPVLGADGTGREHDILVALGQLAIGRALADAGLPGGLHVDVVNLSLGFYHETPALLGVDSPIATCLADLVAAGVAVVAAAGNGATTAPFVPAALVDVVQGLHSVGALNPDGETVALFSNGGAWVREHAVGACVVSTVPTTLAGSGRASVVSDDPTQPRYGVRATVDPDSHTSGFAVWSGTSFAAPRVAGDLAAALVAKGGDDG